MACFSELSCRASADSPHLLTLGREDFSATKTDGCADVFRLRSFAAWSPENVPRGASATAKKRYRQLHPFRNWHEFSIGHNFLRCGDRIDGAYFPTGALISLVRPSAPPPCPGSRRSDRSSRRAPRWWESGPLGTVVPFRTTPPDPLRVWTAWHPEPVIQVEMAKGGIEIIAPQQTYHPPAEPEAFRIGSGAAQVLLGFGKFVGLLCSVLRVGSRRLLSRLRIDVLCGRRAGKAQHRHAQGGGKETQTGTVHGCSEL